MRGHLTAHRYLVALGSNQRHPRLGLPRRVVAAAMDTLAAEVGEVQARSRIIRSAPVGPSLRRYANAAVVLDSPLEPSALLDRLQTIEARFGRRRIGQRWRARVLDLDIVLWSGGVVGKPDLVVPHPLFRIRDFVLCPATTVAPDWRDPLTGRTLRQLHARLTRHRPLPR